MAKDEYFVHAIDPNVNDDTTALILVPGLH